ncbi:MAG: DUF2059 domain-containing protein [Xanthobacteraceae bacterium]|nr:DUF2059 domain-containing protein [Burkholderiales bacterium]MCZ7659081.1 DUF2059 domain-containing protein [Xanthobacteraceae bacterium]PWB62844.1 MAG: hypothetical protein C3F17_10630 [Bradyrhizobiaceae bacterium]GIK80640.1 MAG: hypothetical protein BroJett024_17450 [Alphaproteobacteria bacterium]
MFAIHISRALRVAALGLAVIAWPAVAQQPPAASIALAKELIELKGAQSMFDPLIVGVVEQTKGVLLQTNPQLAKDMEEVAGKLRTELAPRRSELMTRVATLYAQQFTENELKEAVTFFKTPLGRKITTQEPVILDQSFAFMQQWANTLSEEVMSKFRAEMKKKGHNL